jgi:predicted HAD superfamily Cof-like phosphohydrolase
MKLCDRCNRELDPLEACGCQLEKKQIINCLPHEPVVNIIGPAIHAIDKVREFHDAFGLEVGAPISHRLMKLRCLLMAEELQEFVNAANVILTHIEQGAGVQPKPLGELVKELADLAYVVYGTAVSLGIDLDGAIDAVHESNMSKLGDDGKPVRRADGKVLKGPNYQPPANMERFVW